MLRMSKSGAIIGKTIKNKSKMSYFQTETEYIQTFQPCFLTL